MKETAKNRDIWQEEAEKLEKRIEELEAKLSSLRKDLEDSDAKIEEGEGKESESIIEEIRNILSEAPAMPNVVLYLRMIERLKELTNSYPENFTEPSHPEVT